MTDMDNHLAKLQRAKENEEKAIKLLVLKMLHLNGIIAFDASENVLDSEVESQIKGKG
jgi:hypothetical protein